MLRRVEEHNLAVFLQHLNLLMALSALDHAFVLVSKLKQCCFAGHKLLLKFCLGDFLQRGERLLQ